MHSDDTSYTFSYDIITPGIGIGKKLRATTTTTYYGQMEYRNGKFHRLNLDRGYVDADGRPRLYLRDHQGNIRAVIDAKNGQSTGALLQQTDYYPYGMPHGESLATALKSQNGATLQPYKYAGKEHLTTAGLNTYAFPARNLSAALPLFDTPDPLSENYTHLNPYLYCAANPINAIDQDGRLIIFINGFHPFTSKGGRSYWNAEFVKEASSLLHDNHHIYYDGAKGTCLNYYRNRNVETRMKDGRKQGYEQCERILLSLKDGETIKFITHSMGAAYAKGFIQGMKDFAAEYSIDISDLLQIEIDVAPYQSKDQNSVPGVPTFTLGCHEDWLAKSDGIPDAKNESFSIGHTTLSQDIRLKAHSHTNFTDKLKWVITESTSNPERINEILTQIRATLSK